MSALLVPDEAREIWLAMLLAGGPQVAHPHPPIRGHAHTAAAPVASCAPDLTGKLLERDRVVIGQSGRIDLPRSRAQNTPHGEFHAKSADFAQEDRRRLGSVHRARQPRFARRNKFLTVLTWR
jgi:hypothetical protein